MFFRKPKQAQKPKSKARKSFRFEWLELETRVLPSTVLAWNVYGQTDFGTQDLAATTVATGVSNSLGLTRGSGVTTSGSSANNAWGGRNWASTSGAGISGNEFASFGFTVSSGQVVSLSSIDMNYRRGSNGPSNGLWQYQLNSGSWTTITNVSDEFPSTSSSGGTISAISLTGISALQNLPAGDEVNFQVVPYGSSSSYGSWYVYDLSDSNDLTLDGTVSTGLTGTTTTITSNTPNPSTAGQSVAFNVAVSGGVPNGETVTLEDAGNGNAVVGSGTLSSGLASINVSSLSVGTHEVFAIYGGDATYAASQSSQVDQIVNYATTMTLSADQAGPYTTSSSLTFTATVTGDPSVGTVTYFAGPGLTNPIGSPIAVVNGTADSTPGYTFPSGSSTVTAVYSGGTGFAGSTGTLTIQVSGSASAPSITSVVINQNISALYNAAGQGSTPGAQRSMVEDIVYTFSEPVNILSNSVDPNVFTIAVASGWIGTVPGTVEWAPVAGSNSTQWEVDFGVNPNASGSQAGALASIANGCYTITISDAQSITAVSDGQALSVTPGAAPAAGNPGYATQSFYRLFGDITGGQLVNAYDNLQFESALTTYNPAFDYYEDGLVNAADNFQFNNNLTVNFSGFTPTLMIGDAPVEPLLYQSDVQYVGAFRVPDYSNSTDSMSFGAGALAYNPADNSLFITGQGQSIAEISIPSTIVDSSDLDNLSTATVLQPWKNVLSNLPNQLSGTSDGAPIGGLMVYNGELIGTQFAYYGGAYSQVLSHFVLNSLDLSTASVEGLYQVGSGGRIMAGYMTPIPSEWQAPLGGFTALTGLSDWPIISTESAGPAAIGFNPGDLGSANDPASTYLAYTGGHQLGAYTGPANPMQSGTTSIDGDAFVPGTSSILYFGATGTNYEGYGEPGPWDGTNDATGPQSLNGQYAFQVWAYNANDLVAVQQGQLQPYQVMPYDVWNFTLPIPASCQPEGLAFDPGTGRIYMAIPNADNEVPYSHLPLIEVFQVNVPTGTPVAAPPQIGTLAATPSIPPDPNYPSPGSSPPQWFGTYAGPINEGDNAVLTAGNVYAITSGANITQVAFYLSSDNSDPFSSNDTLLGYGTGTQNLPNGGSTNWALTISTEGLSSGTYTIFAQAEDSNGLLSDPISMTLTIS